MAIEVEYNVVIKEVIPMLNPDACRFSYQCCFVMSLFALVGCGESDTTTTRTLEVTATAFTSSVDETDGDPTTAAWGDTLKPGMKALAVSRDLIDQGLDHETPVRIEGVDGQYIVLDKMNKRWTKRIDIYMGNDKEKAKQWGKKQVTIHWSPPDKGDRE